MYDLSCMLVESRPFVVLDELSGFYGLKYDSATAYGLLLYLCSYELDGSATSELLFHRRQTKIKRTTIIAVLKAEAMGMFVYLDK